MRAYGGTAATCLRHGEKTLVIPTLSSEIECGFSDLALVKSRLAGVPDLTIEREVFTEVGARLSLSIPVANAEDVARMVLDLTSGRVTVPLPQR